MYQVRLRFTTLSLGIVREAKRLVEDDSRISAETLLDEGKTNDGVLLLSSEQKTTLDHATNIVLCHPIYSKHFTKVESAEGGE
jgi:hypothetical protein